MTTTLGELRKAYARAKLNHAYEFTHDGHVFVTSYAGYLIEYFESEYCTSDKVIEFKSKVSA